MLDERVAPLRDDVCPFGLVEQLGKKGEIGGTVVGQPIDARTRHCNAVFDSRVAWRHTADAERGLCVIQPHL